MSIEVSLGKKIYTETYSYAKKRTVRHISAISAKNYLLKIRVYGMEQEAAWETFRKCVTLLGYNPDEDCLSRILNIKTVWDEENRSLTDCICVPKNFNMTSGEQREYLLKKARKVAWCVKKEIKGDNPELLLDSIDEG